MALTDTAIKALKPRVTAYAKADGHGLVIEVLPTGSKVWRLRYRLSGRQEKVTIGPYPEFTLAEARDKAADMRRLVARGESPAATKRREKAAARNPDIVAEFAKVWMSEVVAKDRKDTTQIQRYIDKDIIPAIGNRRLSEVKPADVLAICDRIKKHRGADQTALQVRGVIKRMYAYAVARQLVQFNPAAAIEARYIATPNARERVLSAAEVGRLFRAIDQSNMRRSLKLALRLLMLTMVRKSDLILARWEQIDFDAAEWHIPTTKTGVPHIVYLSVQAIALFEEARRLACGSEWVLPSRSTLAKPIDRATLNVAIKAMDHDLDSFVLHDFRRTASTHLHESGFAPDVIEAALAHTIGGVRGVYNRAQYATQRRDMLQEWANIVDRWAAGAKIIPAKFPSVRTGTR
ncbi:MAG: integrase arm-type DNA-binding domain-containing protein [Gammaproteobacteria bacterium]|nr:integrase arm-type DNA-binding domain-containing protein [Gammaproteobacteria bacterium]